MKNRKFLRRPLSNEHKEKLSIALKGRVKPPFSKQHRENISRALKGRNGHRKGIKHSEETKRKISTSKIGHIYPNRKTGTIKTCLICGKLFYTRKSLANRKKYCSKACHYISTEKRMFGNKFGWKGGITPIRGRIWHSDKNKKWRQDIFTRDNFTCRKCGQFGGRLESHHIYPFHKLLKEVGEYLPLLNIFDGAMLYSPLWDINNGITLCKKCHNKATALENAAQEIRNEKQGILYPTKPERIYNG